MRVFVSGATGFVGSHVVKELIAAGHEVLGLARSEAGAKWHAVAEQGVQFRNNAEIVGRGLNVPVQSIPAEQAPGHFGWWGMFAGIDLLASSEKTRKILGWDPTGPGLLADLQRMDYSQVA